MAKKSNKTEHVLKLITKNDEADQDDDFFVIKEEISQNGTSAMRNVVQPIPIESPIESPVEIKPEIQKELPAAVEKQESPTVRAFREQESVSSAVLEQNDNLVNIAEVLAREKISLVMERMKVCTCQTCVNDVLALALNSLPTKYVTTDAGKQYFQLDIYKKQYETDILAALTKACVRVKAAPRH